MKQVILLIGFLFLGKAADVSAFDENLQSDLKLILQASSERGGLNIVLRNDTKKYLTPVLQLKEEFRYLELIVFNEKEKRIYPVNQVILKEWPTSKDYATLSPGAFYGEFINLEKEYALPTGKYSIIAIYTNNESRRDEKFLWVGQIKSEKIYIEIQ